MTVNRYANFDSSGHFQGFLTGDIHKSIPTTAVLIPESLYQEMLSGNPEAYEVDSAGNVVPIVISAADQLQAAKTEQAGLIKKSFYNELVEGVCNLSLGWSIDCRRGNGNNDTENMQTLLDLALLEGKTDTDKIDAPGIKGSNNIFYDVTISELRDTIIPEMKKFGLSQYQKKFNLEQQINAATTVADVQAITW